MGNNGYLVLGISLFSILLIGGVNIDLEGTLFQITQDAMAAQLIGLAHIGPNGASTMYTVNTATGVATIEVMLDLEARIVGRAVFDERDERLGVETGQCVLT